MNRRMQLFVLVCVAALGCGDAQPARPSAHHGATQTLGVDSSKRIQDLSDDEVGELCDWNATIVPGGYDGRLCPDMTAAMYTSGSKDACMQNARMNDAQCTSTVGDWQTCAKAIAAVDACVDNAFSDAEGSAPCAAFFSDTNCLWIS